MPSMCSGSFPIWTQPARTLAYHSPQLAKLKIDTTPETVRNEPRRKSPVEKATDTVAFCIPGCE
jgi:hypothetical protein